MLLSRNHGVNELMIYANGSIKIIGFHPKNHLTMMNEVWAHGVLTVNEIKKMDDYLKTKCESLN